MQVIIDKIRDKARQNPKRIVFPESTDERILKAVDYVEKNKIAVPILLSSHKLDPERQEEFANFYFEFRKIKGITFEEARETMENPLYYAAMMVRLGYADGFVAGATYTTSSVIWSALHCLEIDENIGLLSSCFIMAIPNCSYGERGVFVYADCGVIPYPTSSQLALISISAGKFARDILDFTPRIALLSFSTKGSARGRWIDKVREATQLAQEKEPNFLIDGELQADAALVPEVAKRKLSDSKVAGKANVLIFPNLDAGNICYKLTQRLANARAVGPIILGVKQPCSDLSRGCSTEDIIDCTAVTVIRAQEKEQIKSNSSQ